MTDKELLLSISKIMDQKLKPIENRIDGVEQNLKADINRLDSKIDTVEQSLKAVEQNLKADIHLINLNLENVIVPRLNEIEACYVSTSKRYMREVDKLVSFDTSLSALQDVVIEHGNRLHLIGA